MKPAQFTREELWVRRQLTAADIDQRLWERDRALLTEASRLSGSCIFVVDTFRCAYVYASGNFAHRFGYDAHRIATIERQSDYLESRIHPDDRMQMLEMQVRLGLFIYAQPPAERNDYPRETEILQLIERGLPSKEIASGLSVSIHTVNIHRQNLLRKLNAQNVAELIRAGRQAGLLD